MTTIVLPAELKEFTELTRTINHKLGKPIVPFLLDPIAAYLESGEGGRPDPKLYNDAATCCGVLVNLFGDVRSIAPTFKVDGCPFGHTRATGGMINSSIKK
jgi:hypothetical protein